MEKWHHLKEMHIFQKRCVWVQSWADEHDGDLPTDHPAESILPDADSEGLFNGTWPKNLLGFVRDTFQVAELSSWQKLTLKRFPCFSRLFPRKPRPEVPSFWWRRLRQLRRWSKVAGRLPSIYTKRSMETKLGWWLDTARKHYRRGKLEEERLSALWSEPLVAGFLSRHLGAGGAVLSWEDRMSSLQAWYMTRNRLPSSHSTDLEEKRLAVWLQNVCAKARRDELHPQRLQELKTLQSKIPPLYERLTPNSTRLLNRWKEKRQQLLDWLSSKRDLPTGGREDEDRLAMWLVCNLANARDGHLDPTRLASLQGLLNLDDDIDWDTCLSQLPSSKDRAGHVLWPDWLLKHVSRAQWKPR